MEEITAKNVYKKTEKQSNTSTQHKVLSKQQQKREQTLKKPRFLAAC